MASGSRLRLLDVVLRSSPPEPWAEGDNIPWHDPGFSMRMLREHLSQEHDAASRRGVVIDRQVGWIHDAVLAGEPTGVLDLGCGPGLYTNRLAALGHRCHGIDYGPASIRHARSSARAGGLDCSYQEADLRTAGYGDDRGLVMLLYGELNVFAPADAHLILGKARAALRPGGVLLLEPHTFEGVRRLGEAAPSWYAAASGLFRDAPHLCLTENSWDAEHRAATTRHYVIDAATGEVERHAQSFQAYREGDYRALLRETGFAEATFHRSLTGQDDEAQEDLCAIVAR